MLLKLAWLQLMAEKRRLLAALAGIAFAVLLQLMQFGFRDALFTSATVLYSHLNADLILASSQYRYIALPGTLTRRRLAQTLAIPQVASVAPLYLGMAKFKNTETHQDRQVQVIAFNPNDDVLRVPGFAANAASLKVPDLVLFDARSHPDFGPVARQVQTQKLVTTEIEGHRVTIAGLFELGVSFAATGHMVMGDQTFRRIFSRPEGVFELGLIRLKPGSDVSAALAEIAQRLPTDVTVTTREQFIEGEKAYWDTVSPIGFIFLMGSFIGLIVGAVIVYQILYTDVSDHLAEYATLKAMGYSNRQFYLVVLEEALILSVFGFPIGYALSELLYSAGRNATHLPLEMTGTRAAVVFVLTVTTCALSGLLATRKLSAADPAEIF
jgi:heterocyst specific transport system permease protein